MSPRNGIPHRPKKIDNLNDFNDAVSRLAEAIARECYWDGRPTAKEYNMAQKFLWAMATEEVQFELVAR